MSGTARERRPALEELRAVAQPAGLTSRRSAEHWAGRWYMRRISVRVTRWLVPAPVSPNGLTVAMMAVGLLAAAAAALPGLATALLAAVLVQGYLLLDCVDGELARWRGATSAAGVYLDRLGHFVVEAALLVALGVRAAGGPSTAPSWWVALGLLAALLAVLGKLESDLVTVARAGAGMPAGGREETDPRSRVTMIRRLRSVLARLPVHRLIGAVELSLLLVVAAGIDAALGALTGARGLLIAAAAVGAVVALGHPVTILTSGRLR